MAYISHNISGQFERQGYFLFEFEKVISYRSLNRRGYNKSELNPTPLVYGKN